MKEKNLKVVVTVNITYNDDLRDDQLEEIALDAVVNFRPVQGFIGNTHYRVQFDNKEIDYHDL